MVGAGNAMSARTLSPHSLVLFEFCGVPEVPVIGAVFADLFVKTLVGRPGSASMRQASCLTSYLWQAGCGYGGQWQHGVD